MYKAIRIGLVSSSLAYCARPFGSSLFGGYAPLTIEQWPDFCDILREIMFAPSLQVELPASTHSFCRTLYRKSDKIRPTFVHGCVMALDIRSQRSLYTIFALCG